jgi:DNA (cytosine-5)-methyltransferase 1
MVIYSCEKCGKTFKQKGHYMKHLQRKTPCDNIKDKIENIVEKKVDELVKEKLQDLVDKGEIEIKNTNLISNNQNSNIENTEMGDKKEFKMIDLFAGTGAFSRAFENKGIKCCFANDFCKNSQKIFDLNHDINLTYGDLNDIKNEDIPKHEILCGGFPCQPFSIAGKQHGFEDERSNVFWKIINIIKHHNPEVVILENVKNLKSHDKGNTFKVIYEKISELGYHIKYQILNTSKITDVPQNRERIYIVCFKDKEKYDKFNFDFTEVKKKTIVDMLEQKEIQENYYYTDRFKVYDSVKEGVTKDISENILYQYRRYYVRENKNNVCPTLTANMGGGGHNVPLLKDKKGIRRLTPRECFNLQGFPENYKLPDVCDGALYRLAGNAVSLPVVELIAEKVSSIIEN